MEEAGTGERRLGSNAKVVRRSWFDRLTMSGKERRFFGERFMRDIVRANAVSDELLKRHGL